MSESGAAADPLHGVDLVEEAGALLFSILVAPKASRSSIGPVVGDRVRVAVKAPPVDGKANAQVIETLARGLGVKKSAVSIVSGARGKRKRVRVEGATRASLRGALA